MHGLNYLGDMSTHIDSLKKQGHDLVDALVLSGMHRAYVYNSLQRALKCPKGREHFALMRTNSQIRIAIKILSKMLHERELSTCEELPDNVR